MQQIRKAERLKGLQMLFAYSFLNIELLTSLVIDAENLIKSKHTTSLEKFSLEELFDLNRNVSYQKAILEGNEKLSKFNPKSDNVKRFFKESTIKFHKENFLAGMALTYLAILFENFIELQFNQVLRFKKSLLKNEKSISYKEIIESGNIEKIYSTMIDKEIKSFLYDGINGLELFLEKKFKLDVKTKFKNWRKIKEIFLRRNLIVHNRGFQDEKYLKIMGYKKRVRIQTNLKYYYRSVKIVKSFMLFLNKEMQKISNM